eukprot:CAMPEP_0201228580 /NCGR_PEP_ID=MMETSP0852-20130820/79_1 /ASSEMBLY_ACC=CAM_ASM_000632 /TAXON_ID=183588 /ORGANISM="Pseudo-nitzschia fraudulenta, Strain WWA7" /LENGTH=76 /DNA_ID=CAMNT_0047518403 /DNA_START=97 /DNA_END=323 /DNA_ORIENTATION=-
MTHKREIERRLAPAIRMKTRNHNEAGTVSNTKDKAITSKGAGGHFYISYRRGPRVIRNRGGCNNNNKQRQRITKSR